MMCHYLEWNLNPDFLGLTPAFYPLIYRDQLQAIAKAY